LIVPSNIFTHFIRKKKERAILHPLFPLVVLLYTGCRVYPGHFAGAVVRSSAPGCLESSDRRFLRHRLLLGRLGIYRLRLRGSSNGQEDHTAFMLDPLEAHSIAVAPSPDLNAIIGRDT